MSLEMPRAQNYAFNLINGLVGCSNIRLFEFMIDWRLTVEFEKNIRENCVNHFSMGILIWEVRAVHGTAPYVDIHECTDVHSAYNSMGQWDPLTWKKW